MFVMEEEEGMRYTKSNGTGFIKSVRLLLRLGGRDGPRVLVRLTLLKKENQLLKKEIVSSR